MKYCPQCNAQYDYEMSFCLQDGTPLKTLDNIQQSENDTEKTLAIPQTSLSQPTLIAQDPTDRTLILPNSGQSEKTVVLPENIATKPILPPTENWNNPPNNWQNKQTNPQQVKQSFPNQPAFTALQFNDEPKKTNVGLLVGLISTGLILIGTAVGAILFLQQPSKNIASSNTIPNTNKSSQLQINNSNVNTSVNASQVFGNNSGSTNQVSNNGDKTSPKPTATTENTPKLPPTPDTKSSETDQPPTPKTPTPIVNPPTPPNNIPKVVSGGVVNGKAVNLVKPGYPPAARAVHASGAVNVQVTIDEDGNVISASAVSGHPLLRAAAVDAARASKFSPMVLSGQRVKVTGVIVYNFIP